MPCCEDDFTRGQGPTGASFESSREPQPRSGGSLGGQWCFTEMRIREEKSLWEGHEIWCVIQGLRTGEGSTQRKAWDVQQWMDEVLRLDDIVGWGKQKEGPSLWRQFPSLLIQKKGCCKGRQRRGAGEGGGWGDLCLW